jgi:collagenase-like PrtC family protease
MPTQQDRNKPSARPEILAPAGGPPQLEAAVHAGADAVYFGLDHGLNARARATSFAYAALGATMDYLHEHNVRGYLALNTLVFDEELELAEEAIRHAATAGVDALIVQDIGLAQLATAVAPHLPLHGSTQMSVTDANGADLARALGCERVVVGRELSIDEIARIVEASDIEVEVFVHGALCVSYSGQCFSSEAWGGRSANRGQCAQACRLPYGLLVDGAIRDQGDLNYLLSPQDLMALELLPRLVDAGVHCFKIEGRLKGPDYVVATVSAYRQALDRLLAGDAKPDPASERDRRRQLAQVFARGQDVDHDGLTPGFLLGPQHQSLVIGRNPRHRGLFVGEVEGVTRRGVQLSLRGPLKRGDGVVFDRGRPQEKEIGGNVHHVIDTAGRSLTIESDSGKVELRFGDVFALERVNIGDRIWRTRDSAADGAARQTSQRYAHRDAVGISIDGDIARPLRISLTDVNGKSGTAASEIPLQPATGKPLDEARLAKAIGTLGDTPFVIDRLNMGPTLSDKALFLPPGEIKATRRRAVQALLDARRQHDRSLDVPSAAVLPTLIGETAARSPGKAVQPGITLLCRTREQVDAALAETDVGSVIVDFLEVHGLKDACTAVREAGRRLIVAAPRVFKPGEERLWLYYCRLSPDALLVRSAGLLWHLHQLGGAGARVPGQDAIIPPLHGDFALNAANVLAARRLLSLGLERLAPTHDLNGDQIIALVDTLDTAERDRIEVIVHQPLPIFHTEYCVFARFLSNGDSYRDCGRPCERHTVHVRDPAGGDHLVQADIGCRNTVFNAAAQSAGALLARFRSAQIRHFRIELVDEPADQVGNIVAAYQAAIDRTLSAEQLATRLGEVRDANGNRQGVGLGSLAVRVEQRREQMKKPTAR